MVRNDKKNSLSSNPVAWMQDSVSALLKPSVKTETKNKHKDKQENNSSEEAKSSESIATAEQQDTQSSIDVFSKISDSTFVALESLPGMGAFSVVVSSAVNQALPKIEIKQNETETGSQDINENSVSGQISLSQQAILQNQPNYHEVWKHLENAWMIFEEENENPPTQETLAAASNILQQMAVLAPLAGRSNEFHQYVQQAEEMRQSIVLEGDSQKPEEVDRFSGFLDSITRLALEGEKNISQSAQEEADLAKVWQHITAGLGAFEAAFSPKGQLTALVNWRRATQTEWKGLQASIQNGELDPETALNLQNSFIEQGQAYAELLNGLIETKRAQLPPSYKTQRLGKDAIMIPVETPDSTEIKELIAMRQEVQKNLLQIKKLDFTDSKQVSKIAAAASRADFYLKQSQIKILEEKLTEVDSIPTTEGHASLARLKSEIEKFESLHRDTLLSPENGNSYLAIWHQLDELKTGRQAIAQEEAIAATKGMFNLAHNLSLGSVGNSKAIEDLRTLYKQIYNQWHDGDHLSKIRAQSAFNEVAQSDHAKWYQRETQRATAVNWLGNVGIIAASAGIGHAFSTGVVEFLEASGFVRGAALLKNIGFSANTFGFWYSHRAIQQGLMQEPFYPKGMTNAEKIYSSVEELIMTGVTLRVLGITQQKYYRMSPAIKKAEEAVLKRLETASAKQGEIIIDESMLRGLVQKELELRPYLLDSYLGGSIIREMGAMTRVGVGESIYHSTLHQDESDPRQILKTALQSNLSPEGILNNGAMVLGLRTLNSGIAHNQSQLNAWFSNAARRAGNKIKESTNNSGNGGPSGDALVLTTPGGFQIKVGGGSFDSNGFSAHPRGKVAPMEARAKDNPYGRVKTRVQDALRELERTGKDEQSQEAKDRLLDEVLSMFFVSNLKHLSENPKLESQVREWIEYQIGDAKELSPGLASRAWNILTRKKTNRSLEDFVQASAKMTEHFNQKEAGLAHSTSINATNRPNSIESSALIEALVIKSMQTADKETGLTGLEARFKELSSQHYQSLERLAIEASSPEMPIEEAAQYHEALSKCEYIADRYSRLNPEQRTAAIIAMAKLYQAEMLTRNKTQSIEDFISQNTVAIAVFNHAYERIVPTIDTASELLKDGRIQEQLPFLKDLNENEREDFIFIVMREVDLNLDSKREPLTETEIQDFLNYLSQNSQKIIQQAKIKIAETCLQDRKTGGVYIEQGSREEVAKMILNVIGESQGPLTETLRKRVKEYIKTHAQELNHYRIAVAKRNEASTLPSSFGQLALDPKSSLAPNDARALTELFPFQKRLEGEIAKKQAEHSSRESGLSPEVIKTRYQPGRQSFAKVFAQYTRDIQILAKCFGNLQAALGSEPNLAKAISPTGIKNNPKKAREALLALDARLSSENGTPSLTDAKLTFGSGKNTLTIQLQASTKGSGFRAEPHQDVRKLQSDIRQILQTFFKVQSGEPMSAQQLAALPAFREAAAKPIANPRIWLTDYWIMSSGDLYLGLATETIRNHGDIFEGANTRPTRISPLTVFEKLESGDLLPQKK